MAVSFFSFASLLLAVLGLRYLITARSHAKKARKWHCGPPPRFPTDILGIGSVREAIRADKKGLIPPLMQHRLDTVSVHENRSVTTFRIGQFGRDVISTCDPLNIQAMLAIKFKDFELGEARRHTMAPLLGNGIFTTDGEAWHRSRALLRPQFTRDQISDLDLEERHVQEAMLAMPVTDNTGWTAATNIQEIFFRLTIDSATEFLFGESAESQVEALRNKGKQPTENFPAYFDRSQWYASQRARFEKVYWLVDNKESRHVLSKVHSYVDAFVNATLNRPHNEKQHGSYVFLTALAESTQDPIELRSQVLNILLAGRDTTASLLSWSVLMLARHPDIFTKLRQTILTEFGPYSRSSRDHITFTSLKSCRYLQHFMNEVLRLYPVVPVNRRRATCDTFLPRGGGPDGQQPVYVRAGESVMYSVFTMQRRKEWWGEDCEEFKPDRWTDRKAGWEYLPFNGGPRVCIGQQFALTEAGYVLVRLLQRFDRIEDLHPDQDISYGLTLTMAPMNPVTVRLHEAIS